MSRKQSKQRNDKKRTTNQQANTFKLEDFLPHIEKKGTEMEVFLSSSQIQHLNVEHQLLISSASMSEVFKTFDKQINPLFQETSNPQIIKLYQTWRQWVQNSIAKNNSQRRQLVQRLVENDDKDKRKNPADDYEKRKSHIISREIRQREQFFKIKTNFAAYANAHFQIQTQQIKDLVDFKAKRVEEKNIKEMFEKPLEQKLTDISHNFQQQEKQQQNRLLFLMRQASKIKKMDAQKKLFLIGQKHKNQLSIRQAACKQLGNSVCLLVNIHDAMTFFKK